ncbi:MAG: ATP-binding protein, partial [Bacteroidota bacterium]
REGAFFGNAFTPCPVCAPARQSLLSVLEDQRLVEREIQKLNAELEQRVIQRTAQLEAANKELETFTYSVSHDLKAPLRGIDGYSKLLQDIHSKNLNEEAKIFISTIRSSTMQMNQLIEDLLEYSRLERSNLKNEKVKLFDLIDSTISLFKNDLKNGKFALKLDIPDVELMADEKGLTIVLRNILENAIKFTKENSNPTLEIGLDEQPTSWIIKVKDNGIGFDMKYDKRIFEIFQRLHRAEDYVGTGIGLAMVSKAMQRMNGKVWAKSIPGEGSTFYLEIPKLQ